MLGLRLCARALPSCGKRGPLLITVRGPPTIAAPPVAEHSSRRAGSAIVAHGPSRSAACGILPDQSPNPRSLHQQADSQPLRHQGSTKEVLFNIKNHKHITTQPFSAPEFYHPCTLLLHYGEIHA